MAVASDLPPLEDPLNGNSVILDSRGREIGTADRQRAPALPLRGADRAVMKHAIIAIEDRRFYTNSGVDLRGIARAAVPGRARPGRRPGRLDDPAAVRQDLARRRERAHVFQKLREAALAYHLTRKWSKERILRNYLNSIYFGNGAYGIESAARTYFATTTTGCEQRQAATAARRSCDPAEAALLAGDGRLAERATTRSRTPSPPTSGATSCSLRMLEQGYHDARAVRRASRPEPLPTRDDLTVPKEDTEYPYFTSWIKQQVVDQLGGGQHGARRAFEGGLRVKTTIDSRLQDAAEAAITPVAAVRRPARAPRWSRSPTRRRGPGDGRRRQLRRRAVQPRHPGPAPAGLLVQAVRARRGAAQRHLARTRRGARRRRSSPSRAARGSRSTTTTTPTRA